MRRSLPKVNLVTRSFVVVIGFAFSGTITSAQVVGAAMNISNTYHAFLWLAQPAYGLPAGMNDLGPGTAYAINSADQVLLYNQPNAYVWLPEPAYGFPKGLNSLGSVRAAAAMNRSAQVVGTTNDSHAFLWLPQPAYRLPAGINILPSLGACCDFATGINNLGQVVGYSTGVGHPFIWLPQPAYGLSAGIHDLGKLKGGLNYAQADGINDSGQVVGWSHVATTTNPDALDAFLWANGVMTDLQIGASSSGNFGINAWGQIAGTGYASTSIYAHAFWWSGGTATDLGTLGGGLFSQSGGINASEQIVGATQFDSSGAYHAFIWLPQPAYGLGAGMNDIGTLGGVDSYAYGIADIGNGVDISYSFCPGNDPSVWNNMRASGIQFVMAEAWKGNSGGTYQPCPNSQLMAGQAVQLATGAYAFLNFRTSAPTAAAQITKALDAVCGALGSAPCATSMALKAMAVDVEPCCGEVFSTTRVWQPSHVYVVGATITDPASHIQRVIKCPPKPTACASDTTQPIWNDSGGTTSDGTITWRDDILLVADRINSLAAAVTAIQQQNSGTLKPIIYTSRGDWSLITQNCQSGTNTICTNLVNTVKLWDSESSRTFTAPDGTKHCGDGIVGLMPFTAFPYGWSTRSGNQYDLGPPPNCSGNPNLFGATYGDFDLDFFDLALFQ